MSKSNFKPMNSVTDVKDIPESARKRSRPRLIAVVHPSCTGCEVCVDFCPVDCIDDLPPVESSGERIPSIRIREEECIGCQICAKVCDELTWNAIEMVPVDEFERRSGLRVGSVTTANSAVV
jgi:Pyruvate/2-oxoacid:ferredoxin oxidoreductase delta subunit